MSLTPKRLLVFTSLLLCFGLSSCQCSDKPDIGPVEDEQAVVTVQEGRVV